MVTYNLTASQNSAQEVTVVSNAMQVYEVFIRATPEKVWAALTQPEFTERYFFGTRVAVEAREGAAITYALPDGSTLVEGRVLSARAPDLLSHTWRAYYDPAAKDEVSTVTWRCEKRGDTTKLTATHDLADAPVTANNVGNDGWTVVLSSLKTLLETGEALIVGAA